MNELPFSPASERNKRPILERLQDLLPVQGRLLEIGAGTGQHAVFFAPRFPRLKWLATERAEAFAGLQQRIDLEGTPGMPAPVVLDVMVGPWPRGPFDAAFSANTAHIMPWAAVCAMFAGVASVLVRGAPFCLYGPFNVDGAFTAPSNQAFDADLRARDPAMGLRDLADIDRVARSSGLVPEARIETPTNNFTLVFRRGGPASSGLTP